MHAFKTSSLCGKAWKLVVYMYNYSNMFSAMNHNIGGKWWQKVVQVIEIKCYNYCYSAATIRQWRRCKSFANFSSFLKPKVKYRTLTGTKFYFIWKSSCKFLWWMKKKKYGPNRNFIYLPNFFSFSMRLPQKQKGSDPGVFCRGLDRKRNPLRNHEEPEAKPLIRDELIHKPEAN